MPAGCQRLTQGDLHRLELKFGQNEHGLEYSLDFALPAGAPLLLWQLGVGEQESAAAHR